MKGGETVAGKGKKVGTITHYYTKIGVGIIKLGAGLKPGDKIKIKGVKTDFEQVVDQMQLEHKSIELGEKGQEIGLKLAQRVREGDSVYLVE